MSRVTVLLCGVMVLLGLAMIAVTLARGGGPVATGMLLGPLFVAAGLGRRWAVRRR